MQSMRWPLGLLCAAAAATVARADQCPPGGQSFCGCDWTKNGTACGPSDDGSECFCRCCCSYEKPDFECKWKPDPTPPPAPPPPPLPPPPPGVLSPAEMVKRMGMGTNLGNTLEAPLEGQWAPAAKESFFDEFKAAGFGNVRVPVRWDRHTGTSPPYTVDATFMDRVEEVVGWSLSHGMVTIINSHHDDWLDNTTTFTAELPRFKAIWTQIADRFQSQPETLLFEVFNEPHVMTAAQLNQMNAAVHPIIRATNPNRIVVLGGLQWMSPFWMFNNPGAMAIPAGDPQLILEIHSYDPSDYAMCGEAVKQCGRHSWGSADDHAALDAWMDSIAQWSAKYHLPIYYGEFGCTHVQNASTGRDDWYAAHAAAVAKRGFAAAVWDDDGSYRLFDRNADTWDAGVLKALGKQVPP